MYGAINSQHEKVAASGCSMPGTQLSDTLIPKISTNADTRLRDLSKGIQSIGKV